MLNTQALCCGMPNAHAYMCMDGTHAWARACMAYRRSIPRMRRMHACVPGCLWPARCTAGVHQRRRPQRAALPHRGARGGGLDAAARRPAQHAGGGPRDHGQRAHVDAVPAGNQPGDAGQGACEREGGDAAACHAVHAQRVPPQPASLIRGACMLTRHRQAGTRMQADAAQPMHMHTAPNAPWAHNTGRPPCAPPALSCRRRWTRCWATAPCPTSPTMAA